MKHYFILFIMLTLAYFHTWAQTVKVTSSVTPSEQSYKVVSYADKWHAIEGCSAKYSFEVTGFDSIASVTSCTYISRGLPTDIKGLCTLNKGVLTISDVEIRNLQCSEITVYDFELKIIVKEKDKLIDTNVSSVKARDIVVYPKPIPSMKETPRYLTYYKSTELLTWQFGGTGGGEWKTTWIAGGETSDMSFYSLLDYKGSSINVALTAVNIAPDGVTEWGRYEDSWKVNVLPEAVCTPTVISGTKAELFQDQSWRLAVETSGGNTDGWTYEWTVDGTNVGENAPAYELTSGTTSSKNIERSVRLTVRNKMPMGTMPTTEPQWTYTYNATFYPCPVVMFKEYYPKNICDGDIVSMGYAILDDNGNSLVDNPSFNWTVKWNNNVQKEYIFQGHNPNDEEGQQNTVTCTVSGKLNGISKPYEKTLSHTFTVWPKPVVAPLTSTQDSRVGCGGNPLSVLVPAFGGQKDGWQFYYQVVGEGTSGNGNSKLLQIPLNRPQEDSVKPEKDLIEIKATNTVEGKLRCDTTLAINVDIYPEPWMPDNVTLRDINRGQVAGNAIREGNTISLGCGQCYGGYPSAWSYEWVKDGMTVSNDREETIPVGIYYSGDGMDYSKETTISCNVDNNYNDELWASCQYTKTLRVYHKPKTPTSLAVKGNGTSGTLIATTPVSDDALEGLHYYLVFGYQDANGQMHDTSAQQQQNVGQVRWSVNVPTAAINTQGNTPYVYALWKYDNGAEVTSGLCMAGSRDEQWDGSTYNGTTRAVLSAASAIYDYQIDNLNSVQTIEFATDGIVAKQTKGIVIQRMNDGTVRKIVRK